MKKARVLICDDEFDPPSSLAGRTQGCWRGGPPLASSRRVEPEGTWVPSGESTTDL